MKRTLKTTLFSILFTVAFIGSPALAGSMTDNPEMKTYKSSAESRINKVNKRLTNYEKKEPSKAKAMKMESKKLEKRISALESEKPENWKKTKATLEKDLMKLENQSSNM